MLTDVIAGARGRRTSQARTGRGQSAGSYFGLWTRSAEKGRGGWYYRAKEEEWKGQGRREVSVRCIPKGRDNVGEILHIMLLANVEATTNYMHTPGFQYDVGRHWQAAEPVQ